MCHAIIKIVLFKKKPVFNFLFVNKLGINRYKTTSIALTMIHILRGYLSQTYKFNFKKHQG